MNMLRSQPNNLRLAQRAYRSGGPDLVTQCHSDKPIPLLFHSAKVPTVFPVALIVAPDLYFEKLHALFQDADENSVCQCPITSFSHPVGIAPLNVEIGEAALLALSP
jgi:hypothetical protein